MNSRRYNRQDTGFEGTADGRRAGRADYRAGGPRPRIHEMRIDECLKESGLAREEDIIIREQQFGRGAQRGAGHAPRTGGAASAAGCRTGSRCVGSIDAWIEQNQLTEHARLGEALAVVPGWERAVETALGHFLSALQVDNLDEFAAVTGGPTGW